MLEAAHMLIISGSFNLQEIEIDQNMSKCVDKSGESAVFSGAALSVQL